MPRLPNSPLDQRMYKLSSISLTFRLIKTQWIWILASFFQFLAPTTRTQTHMQIRAYITSKIRNTLNFRKERFQRRSMFLFFFSFFDAHTLFFHSRTREMYFWFFNSWFLASQNEIVILKTIAIYVYERGSL